MSFLAIAYIRHQSRKGPSEVEARPLILASQFHVSAISLGEPRLAIVDGRQVTEGDSIDISVPNHAIPVTLRVSKIADGWVELSHGAKVITVRLDAAFPGPTRKP